MSCASATHRARYQRMPRALRSARRSGLSLAARLRVLSIQAPSLTTVSWPSSLLSRLVLAASARYRGFTRGRGSMPTVSRRNFCAGVVFCHPDFTNRAIVDYFQSEDKGTMPVAFALAMYDPRPGDPDC